MKKLLSIISILAMLVTSCQKEKTEREGNFSISASREALQTGTKATVSDEGAFSWSTGDAIGLYNGSSFSKLTTAESGASVTFTGTVVGEPSNCAIFPYAIAKTTASVTLPDTYEWKADDVQAAMIAPYNAEGLAFKHIGGIIKVSLKNVPAAATKFVLTADKDITGDFDIATVDGNSQISSSADNGKKSVAFTFAAGSATAMDFYVPVPVGEYVISSVSLQNAEGTTLWEFAGSTANEVTRAKLLIMPTLTIVSIPGSGENMGVSITVPENYSGTFYLPETTSDVVMTVQHTSNEVTIAYPEGAASTPANVSIDCGTNTTLSNLTIDLPNSHVEINGVTVSNLTASTSSTTLVIGEDVTVGTLTINQGSAVIKGAVSNLVRGAEQTGNIEWHVKNAAEFNSAVKVANKVILKESIALESSSTINNGAVITIDLNGKNISAPSKVLCIANAKVDIVGSGFVYETEDNQYGALLLSGSNEDVANYTVVNIGEQVVLAGWSGIFVAKDVAGGYKNYGLVVNCKGTLQNPGMAGHTTAGYSAYINGSNNNTSGNVPKFNFNGSTFSSKGTGIYAAGYAEWTLDNCNISAAETAIEIRAGKMTINSGSYESTMDPFKVEPNGNGTTTSGAALGISQHSTDLPIDVTVNGGTFTGAYAIWEKDVQNETAKDKIKLTVNGGTFNGAIYSQNNQNCLVGGTYDDVSALDYMGNYKGDINITMARDGSICTSNFYLNRGGANTSTITLNGNGHKLTFHSTYRNHIQTTNGAKIILKNATVDSDYNVEGSTWDDYGLIFDCPTEFENVTFNRQLVLEQPYTHKLTNVTINQTSATGDMYALWIEAGAKVTCNGGAINALSPNGNKNRAIKIADQYITNPQLTELSVSGITFKSDKKAAVLVTSTAGANIVWGEGNDISQVAADQTNAVWNDADRNAAWDLVTVTGCTKYQEQ